MVEECIAAIWCAIFTNEFRAQRRRSRASVVLLASVSLSRTAGSAAVWRVFRSGYILNVLSLAVIGNTSPRHAVCSTADLPTEKSHDPLDCKCEPCICPDLYQPRRVGTNEVERSSQPDLYHQGDRGQSRRSANGATRPGKGSQ